MQSEGEQQQEAQSPPNITINTTSVDRSLLCMAVGQMNVIRPLSASEELADRVPDAFHPQIDWLKKQGHASAHALLQAWKHQGLVVRDGRLSRSKIMWMEVMYALLSGLPMLFFFFASAWLAHDTKVFVDWAMLMGLVVASAVSLVGIAHFHIWPHIIGARAVRALSQWEQSR